ncbi:DUF4129 domain-containing protein [uncultured Pseudokineococcus sp.]|uniref:DUF4129 domain-containing protein n=1 Tax=uncultured Pseudokineococcus sp. TaxID=1642928 RepID=UPI002632DB49|nr:DUF4129 domain-containing protein [uncultured Pseudokineococcus sp.]
MDAVLAAVPAPVDLGRDEAQDLLVRELSGSVYTEARPGLLQRALTWLRDRVLELLPDDLDAGPAVDALVVAALVVLVLVALRVGAQVARRRRVPEPAAAEVFSGARRSAEDHRARADALAREGDWPGAVAERFRAVVRGAEERVLLDERPGRTASEAAAELGAALPPVAADLRAGARVFDDVVYGSAPGSAEDDARLRRLDDAVRASRPSVASTGAPT